MHYRKLILLLLIIPVQVFSQNAKNPRLKKTWYVAAGYNLDWFSKSDIHFKNNGGHEYDFTLHDVSAKDRPGLKKLFHQNITIPQYSFRIGLYFNDKHNLGFEISYDHAKYVMRQYQKVRFTGTIEGHYLDQDTIITPDRITFEHTNGANFCMFTLIKRWKLWQQRDYRHSLHGLVKPGFGFVYPKSDVTIFGVNRNEKYHVAGYVGGVDAGFRFKFFRYFFLDTSLKASFVNYTNVLLPFGGRATHHFLAYEYIFTTGFQFGR